MQSEWQTVPFAELYAVPSRNGLTKPKRVRGEGYKFINMGEIFKYQRMLNVPCERVPANDKELSTSVLEPGDLLFARQSLVLSGAGKCSVFLGDDEIVVFESHLIRVRPILSLVNPEYLFYYFNSPVGRSEIWGITEQGAGQAGIRGSDLKTVNVTFPSLAEQNRIVNALSALDDKIELNRKMNETLEAMAQALFKSWFVDFDPVIDNALAAGNEIPEPLQERAAARQALGDQRKPLPPEIQSQFPSRFVFTDEMGWIPEGWEVVELSAVTTELRRGISPKYTESGGVRVVNQKCIRNHLIDFSLTRRNDPTLRKFDGREIHVGDVLVNSTGVGTLGRMAQVLNLDEPTVVDSHVTVVRADPKAFKSSVFGLMMLNLESIVEAMGEGSTGQTELSRANMQALKVLHPGLDLQETLEQMLRNISARQVVISNESEALGRTRDTLLPKLISGELRVADAEQLVAEVI